MTFLIKTKQSSSTMKGECVPPANSQTVLSGGQEKAFCVGFIWSTGKL